VGITLEFRIVLSIPDDEFLTGGLPLPVWRGTYP
jgi:hypothetical protein